jgi:Protein of unknown function (Gmx_para_CXXCG)
MKKWSLQLKSSNNISLAPFYLMVSDETCIADSDIKSVPASKIIECPINQGHKRSKRLEDLDLVVSCALPTDFIFTWMSDCVIRNSALQVMAENHITGFETRAAQVRVERTGLKIAAKELVVTGWGGMSLPESGIKETYRCPGCGLIIYSGITDSGHLIDIRSWDGSDIFMVWPLPRYLFVTERFVEMSRDFDLSGISFTQSFPNVPVGVLSGFTPGRLSDYMPYHRAHFLGMSEDIV